MMRIEPMLWKFAEPHFDAAVDGKSLEAGRDALRSDLASGIRSEQVSFWICTGMVIALFLGAFLLVILNLNQPKLIQVIFAVTGVSLTALIRQMITLWRERARMVLVKQLADSLPAKDLKPIILLLLKTKA